MPKYVITKAADIPVGSRQCVTVAGRDIVVFNVDGEYFGLADKCPHRGARLSAGMLVGRIESGGYGDYHLKSRGTTVRCPWHGWEYDLKTGRSFCDPNHVRARGYEIEAVPGQSIVEGPFKAEAFPIEREADYLVIELPR
jgi:3-phenylpropionate/trans-cinnamate dioxygenase ferredoxin subunit